MQIETLCTQFVKACTTNSTDTSFTSIIPTVTEPSGVGVHELGPGLVRNAARIVPFGKGGDNDTFDMRVFGWTLVGNLWVPHLLGAFNVTLCATVGIVNATVTNGERFADTIALVANTGTANVSNEIVSPTGELIAHIILDLKGCMKVQFVFDATGTTTESNALVSWM